MSTTDIDLREFEREILHGPRPVYNVQLKLYDFFIPGLGAIIITMNLMVVLSSGLILRKRPQPRSTYIFLGNVGLADMFIGIATLFGQYYPKSRRTEMVCCMSIGMIIAATLASVYTVGFIAVDRFLYILYGLQYQRFLVSNRARCMVVFSWILGGVVGFMPAMGVRNSTENGRVCWLIILEPTELVLTTVCIGIFPLVLIIVLYSIILRKALGKISEMRNSEAVLKLPGTRSNSGLRYFRGGSRNTKNSVSSASGRESVVGEGVSYIQEETLEELPTTKRSLFRCCRKKSTIKISPIYSPSRWKAIKIVLLTTGCFFVTWFPYFFACALYAMCDREATPQRCDNLRVAIASPLAILGLANSLLNPIIYAWWHNGFRESAKRIFNSLWNQSVKPRMRDLTRSGTTQGPLPPRPRSYPNMEATASTTSPISNTELTELDNVAFEQTPLDARSSSVILGVLEPLQKQN